MRTILIVAAIVACAFARAQALTVVYDLNSSVGPITLRFDADDAAADTRLRVQQGRSDLSDLIDVTLTIAGTDYTLIGSRDDEGLLDRQSRTVSFVVDEVTRPWANTLTTVNLTFSARMQRIRTLGDLFAYLDSANVVGGNLTIDPADVAVPLPGAMLLFASGAVALAGARRHGAPRKPWRRH